jgi:hypothetical protein
LRPGTRKELAPSARSRQTIATNFARATPRSATYVRDLGPRASEANVGVSVARTPAGNFVVAWGTGFGVRRAVRSVRLDANGRVLNRGALGRRYVTPTTRHIAVAPVASGYLLFAIDTPRAWQEGPTRLRVLHLGRRFQPIGPWGLVVGDVDDPGLTATALDDHEVAVTISPAGGTPPYADTYIVEGSGRLLRDSELAVAVSSGDRGRLLPWPTAPRTLLNATSSDVLPQTVIDAVIVGDQPAFCGGPTARAIPTASQAPRSSG